MAWKVKSAEFVMSAAKIEQLPKALLPEVAFIGRSNAGKSTLVNRICGQKALARVSATPGRTQQINLFLVTLLNGNRSCTIHLADLPGYGFAKVSKSKHFELLDLIRDYFEERSQLKLVLLLSDIKRKINEADLDLVEFLNMRQRQVQVLLTKADKVNQKEKSDSLRENSNSLSLPVKSLILAGNDQTTGQILDRIVEVVDQITID